MADLTKNQSDQSRGKVRAKKLSTRIDMTPMVDLAFLLLTFFILTTTFNDPYVMRLDMPEEVKDPAQVPKLNEKDAMSLVLAENNRVYWWIGFDSPSVTDFSKNGLRKVLLEQRRKNPRVMVLVKPKDGSRYENMIDALDEIQVAGMERYAFVDFTDEDQAAIAQR